MLTICIVQVLSIHPSFCLVWAFYWKTKWRRKIQIVVYIPHGRSNRCASFQFKKL